MRGIVVHRFDLSRFVFPVRRLWFNNDAEGSGVAMLGGGNLAGGINTMQMVVPHLFLGGRRTSAEDFLSLLQVRKRGRGIIFEAFASHLVCCPLFCFCLAYGTMNQCALHRPTWKHFRYPRAVSGGVELLQ